MTKAMGPGRTAIDGKFLYAEANGHRNAQPQMPEIPMISQMYASLKSAAGGGRSPPPPRRREAAPWCAQRSRVPGAEGHTRHAEAVQTRITRTRSCGRRAAHACAKTSVKVLRRRAQHPARLIAIRANVEEHDAPERAATPTQRSALQPLIAMTPTKPCQGVPSNSSLGDRPGESSLAIMKARRPRPDDDNLDANVIGSL